MAKATWMKGKQDGDGAFHRKQSEFRNRVCQDGTFPAEAGRYHLYVQYACPWAHRTLLARQLLGLDDITVDVVSWRMASDGSWPFEPGLPGCTGDSMGDAENLQDVYKAASPDFGDIGTVPVLWDKKAGTIVNNESREIMRMLDTELAPALGKTETLLPAGLENEVDAMIDANYESVNNGVYKCGFARNQEAYNAAIEPLFGRLGELEAHLEGRDWLCGPGRGVLSEADIALWTTLLRFDAVYHTHFKCNVAKIAEHPNLWAFTRRLYQLPGVASTVDFDHIRNHYYWSHTTINPFRIVPRGPDMEALLS